MGGIGVLIHLAILGLFIHLWAFSFLVGQVVATGCAMTMNFFFNNFLTHQDRPLRGWKLLQGLGSFYLICAVGAFANLQVALFLFDLQVPWWLAGLLGGTIGAVWNYAVSSWLTWRKF